ncbi:MAG: TRAP transporter large permease subunit, partial [Bryobacteraceae bacterium]
CAAAVQFVITERAGGQILAYGIPVWWVELAMPLGFALIAIRQLGHASAAWAGRGTAAGLAFVAILIAVYAPVQAANMATPALFALLIATLLGVPIFVTFGGAAMILFWGSDLPISLIPVNHYQQVINPSFPAIPLFTLAGYFLAESGASKRLIRVFLALAGHFRGGPAIVTAIACAFFTSFTGASGVTILALGGLLMPILLAARYTEKSALGLLTGAGSLGLLFPPCLPLILYAIVAQIPIKQMFLGGLGPGFLLVGLTAWWGVRQSPKLAAERPAFRWRELGAASWAAKWERAMPLIAIGGLLAGFATPIEAAALTALYAFVAEVFLNRDLSITRDIPRVMTECGLLIGGVLLILGVALGFTSYLVYAQIPSQAVEWATGAIHSRWVFLLLLNVFLLIVGCLMDIFSAIIIQAPLIAPLGLAFGIDPIHLGILFLANMELGYLTPPVGLNLFLSSYRFKKSLPEVTRSAMPMMLVLLVGVALITFLPALTTTLPGWFTENAPPSLTSLLR